GTGCGPHTCPLPSRYSLDMPRDSIDMPRYSVDMPRYSIDMPRYSIDTPRRTPGGALFCFICPEPRTLYDLLLNEPVPLRA
ncbi:MAG: DUF740 domain-containing protein, partial [Planctomycetota bacterium]